MDLFLLKTKSKLASFRLVTRVDNQVCNLWNDGNTACHLCFILTQGSFVRRRDSSSVYAGQQLRRLDCTRCVRTNQWITLYDIVCLQTLLGRKGVCELSDDPPPECLDITGAPVEAPESIPTRVPIDAATVEPTLMPAQRATSAPAQLTPSTPSFAPVEVLPPVTAPSVDPQTNAPMAVKTLSPIANSATSAPLRMPAATTEAPVQSPATDILAPAVVTEVPIPVNSPSPQTPPATPVPVITASPQTSPATPVPQFKSKSKRKTKSTLSRSKNMTSQSSSWLISKSSKKAKGKGMGMGISKSSKKGKGMGMGKGNDVKSHSKSSKSTPRQEIFLPTFRLRQSGSKIQAKVQSVFVFGEW